MAVMTVMTPELTPANRSLFARGLRHDLPLMVRTCQRLPCGGLPQAGLLAEHCRVVADAMQHLLDLDAQVDGAGVLRPEQDVLTAQLSQVVERMDRLYSAERPGGLDRLDWHLANLCVTTDDYLRISERTQFAGTSAPGAGAAMPDYGPRSSARVLAWAAVACDLEPNEVTVEQPLATRAWMALGVYRRARHRAEALWGPSLSRVRVGAPARTRS